MIQVDVQHPESNLVQPSSMMESEVALEKTNAKLQQRIDYLTGLGQIGSQIVAAREQEIVFQRTVDLLQDYFGWAHVALFTVDDDSQRLVMRAAAGSAVELLPDNVSLAAGTGMIGWAAQHNQPVIAPDVDLQSNYINFYPLTDKIAIHSAFSVPLQVEGFPIGVLDMQSAEPAAFDDGLAQAVKILADQIAIAIENARHYEQAVQKVNAEVTLQHEVNHRVKNNMAAILGLLYAEQQEPDLLKQPLFQTAISDIINRVRGLATVHDMLSAAEWQPLLLSDLAKRVINAAVQAAPVGKRVHVDVETTSVRVTAQQANNLAMVINELATNAVKYGLAETEQPLEIAVKIDYADKRVRMLMRDNGPGYPPGILQQDRRHFNTGFDLIQSIVSLSLSGELALRNDGGAVTEITFAP